MSAFRCPKCQNVTGGDEKFCMKCGYPLDIVCPECGNNWRYMFDYHFCPECGHNMKSGEVKFPVKERHHTSLVSHP
ncbi:double zinc ribbon domain-containing protein [Pelodictyon phaeoclathratiforme]|jgi:predicted amidophosphoribosyltransferase|uniref:double zinc ribbon domain-containing protein n=1 Tax=Pelodictyon phaeoclathratiforme TaxID=34090 RepID=UPI000A0020EC|nr:zinc ribbon domain-containing protein [Pelodictyon phaeoclathratiforme]